MLMPLTIKIINTTESCRGLYGREFTFHFDISLTIYVLKKYLISYLDLNTDRININDRFNLILYDHFTIENTMMSRTYLDIIDNNENIFYLFFSM